MSPRANWKGFLKLGELSCPIALFTAASSSDRIAFHILNRKTGHRIHRQFVDSQTGKPVDAADQTKGYETANHQYVMVEPEEIATAIPESDKTLEVQSFIPCGSVSELYFNRPYYLAPVDGNDEAFALMRDGMRNKKTAAIARAVLFRRMRTLLVRAHDHGMIATTLSFDYEVRSPAAAFKDIPTIEIKGEMLKLAEHIIKSKAGRFDIKEFHDRYEAALAEVVRAKQEGKPVKSRAPEKAANVINLMDALRQSAGTKVAARTKVAKGRSAAAKVSSMAKAAKADRAKSDPAKAKSRQRAAPRRKAG
jgi:DNA end-binding protein Ku